MRINISLAVTIVVLLVAVCVIFALIIGSKEYVIPIKAIIKVKSFDFLKRDVGLGPSHNTDLLFKTVHENNDTGMNVINRLLAREKR